MDLADSASEATFREALAAWLDENSPWEAPPAEAEPYHASVDDAVERTILRKLRDTLLPSEAARSNLRSEILAALKRQLGGESGDAVAAVSRLEATRTSLEGKIDRGLERICYLDESSARMLSEKVRACVRSDA